MESDLGMRSVHKRGQISTNTLVAFVIVIFGLVLLSQSGAIPLAAITQFGDLSVDERTVDVSVSNGQATGSFVLQNDASDETVSYVIWSQITDNRNTAITAPEILAQGNIQPSGQIPFSRVIGQVQPGARYNWVVSIYPEADYTGGNTIRISEEFSFESPVNLQIGTGVQTDFTYMPVQGIREVNWGERVTIEATSTDPNQRFAGWSIIGQIRKNGVIFGAPGFGSTHSENPITFEVLSDVDALATNVQSRFSLTIQVAPEEAEGLVTPTVGTTFYDLDTQVTITSVDSNRFLFDRYDQQGVGVSTNPELTVTMDRPRFVLVVFDVRIATVLSISASPGGTTDPAPGRTDYLEPTSVTITAIPDPGEMFTGWRIAKAGVTTRPTQNPITVIAGGSEGSVSVTALFEIVQAGERTLTIVSDVDVDICIAPGEVLPDGTYTHPQGFSVLLHACDDGTFRPAEGITAFAQTWYVDGKQVSVANLLLIEMDTDHSVELRNGSEPPAQMQPSRGDPIGDGPTIPQLQGISSTVILATGLGALAIGTGFFLLTRKKGKKIF